MSSSDDYKNQKPGRMAILPGAGNHIASPLLPEEILNPNRFKHTLKADYNGTIVTDTFPKDSRHEIVMLVDGGKHMESERPRADRPETRKEVARISGLSMINRMAHAGMKVDYNLFLDLGVTLGNLRQTQQKDLPLHVLVMVGGTNGLQNLHNVQSLRQRGGDTTIDGIFIGNDAEEHKRIAALLRSVPLPQGLSPNIVIVQTPEEAGSAIMHLVNGRCMPPVSILPRNPAPSQLADKPPRA
jgi:hypothetical protein